MRRLVLLPLVAMMSVAVKAQEPGTLTLFSRGHFTGPGVTFSRPTSPITALNVKSVRISPGAVWELCSGNTFSGCQRISESKAGIVRTVRSVRPVSAPIPQTVALPSDGIGSPSGFSLRGLASEFFVVPAEGGSRIEVALKGKAPELGAATRFCRARGWRESAYERVQTVDGRTFLADVLCDN
jgi:hypothetical protein